MDEGIGFGFGFRRSQAEEHYFSYTSNCNWKYKEFSNIIIFQDEQLPSAYSTVPTIIISSGHMSQGLSDRLIPEFNSIASWVEVTHFVISKH